MMNRISVYLLTKMLERQGDSQKRVLDFRPNDIEHWKRYQRMGPMRPPLNIATPGVQGRQGRLK